MWKRRRNRRAASNTIAKYLVRGYKDGDLDCETDGHGEAYRLVGDATADRADDAEPALPSNEATKSYEQALAQFQNAGSHGLGDDQLEMMRIPLDVIDRLEGAGAIVWDAQERRHYISHE